MDENNSILPYPPLPTLSYHPDNYSTPEAKRLTQQIVDRFLEEAKEGNVYEAGAGFGNDRSSLFTIVRLRFGLGIKNIGSSCKPDRLNRVNAIRYIKNGAKLVMSDD